MLSARRGTVAMQGLALMARNRVDNFLDEAYSGIAPDVAIGFVQQIVAKASSNFRCEACGGGRLKQWVFIQLIIVVIEHRIARDLRVCLEPSLDLSAARLAGQVGCAIKQRNAVMPSGEDACRIIAPGRG